MAKKNNPRSPASDNPRSRTSLGSETKNGIFSVISFVLALFFILSVAPFDVTFVPRRDAAALEAAVTRRTAAVIVEPVQGVGGAFDLGSDYLQAVRARCDQVCAQLIFDEVQCGVGRCGWPFAANLYGVVPDMITAAKALGAGFPVGALLLAPHVAAHLSIDALGSTFGGGPLACAVVEAVIDSIREERLLENVRRISALIRARCVTGPVTGTQGEGFLLGLRTRVPARQVQAALLERDILSGTSADPFVLRLLPPYTLESSHVETLATALGALPA